MVAPPGTCAESRLSHARGEFIGFLDSDDRWLPHQLTQQMVLLDANHDCRWCYTDAVVFDGATGDVNVSLQ